MFKKYHFISLLSQDAQTRKPVWIKMEILTACKPEEHCALHYHQKQHDRRENGPGKNSRRATGLNGGFFIFTLIKSPGVCQNVGRLFCYFALPKCLDVI